MNAIMKTEIEEYREGVLQAISKHFSNPYCARTDIGKVIYEKEILDLVNSVRIGSNKN